jgi:hypothetical protein
LSIYEGSYVFSASSLDALDIVREALLVVDSLKEKLWALKAGVNPPGIYPALKLDDYMFSLYFPLA